MPRTDTSPRLLEGPIAATLARMTAPMLVGILAIVAFNFVDTWYVSKLPGDRPLAAMTMTFPVVLCITSFALGLGMGTASVVSRALAQKSGDELRRLVTDCLLFSVLLVAVVAVVGLVTIRPLFQALGTKAAQLPLVTEYMEYWYIGVVFVVVPMVGNGAIRATGDTKTPAVIMIIATIANVILDPIFIFGFGPISAMGLRGAALATVIARAGTLLAAVWVLARRLRMITFGKPRLLVMLRHWGHLVHIGGPVAITAALTPVAMGLILREVTEFGLAAEAAFGVGMRVEALAMTFLMAVSSALLPFVGQNWGAGNGERVRYAVRLCLVVSLGYGALAALVLPLLASVIAQGFSDDARVAGAIVLFLTLMPLSHAPQGVILLAGSTFNALHRPFSASGVVLVRLFALSVPLAYLGAHLDGLHGLFVGWTSANAICGVLAWLWLRRALKTAPEPRCVPPLIDAFIP